MGHSLDEGGDSMRSSSPRGVRRALATIVVVAVGAVGLAAGVGSAQSKGNVDPDGILTVAHDLQVTGVDKGFDPIRSRSVGDFLQMNLVYDTLLKAQDDGTYKPGLAQSYKVEGNNAVTLTLRPNLKFTDGTPLDAAAVKFSIDRAVASRNTNLAPEITNVGTVEAIDPTTVKITMKTPTIGSFFELLAGRETMPVSPTAVNANPAGFNQKPVGAGPMIVSQYTPQSIMSFRKNPDYWDAKNWKLGGIDFIHATAGAPRITAFRGGDANMAELDSSQTEDLEGTPGAEVRAAASDANFLYVATCKNKPPFDNLDFRKAVMTAMDRNAINEVLLGGAGEPMYTMWPSSSGLFTEELEGTYAYNPKKAKKMFQKAGWDSNATLPIGYSLSSPQLKTFGEIFQAQMGEAGVKVELVPLTDIVTQFYTNVQTPAAVSLWIRPGLQKVTRAFGPASVANVCQYSDPTLNNLTAQIAAQPPGSKELGRLWDQTNEFITDNLLWNFGAWQPIVWGWNTEEVGGVKRISPLLQGPDFSTVYIKR
jgi:peptide/nickel transport system substrate-binding protein